MSDLVAEIDDLLDGNEYTVRGVPRTPSEVVELLFGEPAPEGHIRFADPAAVEAQRVWLLGDDGRVWDGHHRIAVALSLQLDRVPVRAS